MNRIFTFGDITVDMENIKNIRTERFPSSNGHYVIIELLKGREYVYHPEKEDYEIFEPQIKEGFGTIEKASFFVKTITEEWNNYLNVRE